MMLEVCNSRQGNANSVCAHTSSKLCNLSEREAIVYTLPLASSTASWAFEAFLEASWDALSALLFALSARSSAFPAACFPVLSAFFAASLAAPLLYNIISFSQKNKIICHTLWCHHAPHCKIHPESATNWFNWVVGIGGLLCKELDILSAYNNGTKEVKIKDHLPI